MTKFEKWLHIIKFGELYMDNLENLPLELEIEEEIKMALNAMKATLANRRVREMINEREKVGHDEASNLLHAKREGKLEVAKNLLDVLDIKTIAAKTGISEEEIKKLKKEK